MWNAQRALGAAAASDAALRLRGASSRQAGLVRRLAGVSFGEVATWVGGLLTVPGNQPATYRLELLASLAAMHATGRRRPTAANLREWINGPLLEDVVGQLEDPVEDVFISNVPTPEGNRRLFDGLWSDNDTGVRALLQAVLRLSECSWAADVLVSCLALLRLSEAVAVRTGVERYASSHGLPGQPLPIVSRDLELGRARVTFSVDELRACGLRAAMLEPFVLLDEHRAALAGERIGHSTFERRPLVWTGTAIVVALPTAIGAAVRRYVLERARQEGALAQVEKHVADMQMAELMSSAPVGLRVTPLGRPEVVADRCHDLVTRFDHGGVLHLVHVGEDMAEVLDEGLGSLQQLPMAVPERMVAVATEMNSEADVRRGLTVLVHGGVGRGFVSMLPGSIGDWHFTGISQSDLAKLWWETGFDALRLWKILDQHAQLPTRGYGVHNVNGLVNLYGFMRERSMTIVPDGNAPAVFELASDFVAGVRERLRSVIDAHVAPVRGGRWLEVQRTGLEVFFHEIEGLQLFSSVGDAVIGQAVSCVETSARPWWIALEPTATTPSGRSCEWQVWEAAQNWLVRAAPRLEELLPDLPAGPIGIRLATPGADALGDSAIDPEAPLDAPTVDVAGGEVQIACQLEHLRTFGRAENVGERLLIGAVARGAAMLAGTSLDDEQVDQFALAVAGSRRSRFIHMLPPRTPSAIVFGSAGLSGPRLLQDEDVAWSRLGLATAAGWTGGPGLLSRDDAPIVLNAAVEAIWTRIEQRLKAFDREKLAAFALENHDSIAWDRTQWAQTASALLALYRDQRDVVAAFNRLETNRGMAGLASRVMAEMAVCTCPEKGGDDVAQADFDAILADIGLMVTCANQSDAIRWNLVDRMPTVQPSGALTFDDSFQKSQQRPYFEAHGERDFRRSAETYEENFAPPSPSDGLQLEKAWIAALEAEYGIGVHGLARLAVALAHEAAAAGTNMLRLRRTELLQRIAGPFDDAPASAPERAFEAMTLKPRASWNEPAPDGAKQRDWYPWRFNRRLSLLQRPFLQIDAGEDPLVLVHPTLLDSFIQRIFLTRDGLLPVELFSSKDMRSWIGFAVNREGHAFNRRVADSLAAVGWSTRHDVKLTELGGGQELGDVDVLAWHPSSGQVLAIECKRLQKARSIGEIGERLHEYSTVAPPGGKRTPIQKHVDRLAALRGQPAELARLTEITPDRLRLRSVLVTDHLVPMQFSRKAAALLDEIVEFRDIALTLKPEGWI